LATKQYDKAMQATESACALSAEDAVAWNLRGCVFFELGRLAEALEYFTIVTRLDPDEILGWSNMAVVLDNLERDKDAVTAIRRAIELSPEQVALWSQLSAYQLGSGQNEAVLESTSRCIQLDPTFTSALITRSLALRELGRLDEALECSDRALETDRSEAYCWICKAFTLAELGREKDAIATLDEALSAVRYPQDALRAKSNLLSDKFGRHTEALEPMKQAWQMAREDNVIASNYAEMLIISGHYADGRAIANEVAARESKPSRSCAMRFIIFVSYALPGDFSGYENALDSFISYYAHEFGKRDRTAIDWDYSGLISVVRSGAFSEGNKFVIETLTDLQRGRIQAKDVSYLSGKVDDSRGSSMS
jgi:tetratricopeptide (TPR) repeat protein